MDERIVDEIRRRLEDARSTERVSVLLAVESGSGAWGFPSPGSDYDCRFIYVRGIDETLVLLRKRDVIELPLTSVFDINGWELAKAVKLLLKGSAVIVEWLQSAFAYLRDDEFCRDVLKLAQRISRREAVAHYYLHILYSMSKRVLHDPDDVELKKTDLYCGMAQAAIT